MDIGVEISLYPLKADFVPVIHEFLERVNRAGRLRVVTSSMSTAAIVASAPSLGRAKAAP